MWQTPKAAILQISSSGEDENESETVSGKSNRDGTNIAKEEEKDINKLQRRNLNGDNLTY